MARIVSNTLTLSLFELRGGQGSLLVVIARGRGRRLSQHPYDQLDDSRQRTLARDTERDTHRAHRHSCAMRACAHRLKDRGTISEVRGYPRVEAVTEFVLSIGPGAALAESPYPGRLADPNSSASILGVF